MDAEPLRLALLAVVVAHHYGGARDRARAITEAEDALRGGDPTQPWGPQELVCGRCGLPHGVHGHGETGRPDSHLFAEPVPFAEWDRVRRKT